MQRTFRTWLLAALLLSAGVASGQDPALTEMFGAGVHAYFAGQPSTAYQHLTASINGGSRDPRSYYFRGLTYLQLGRPKEADADFVRGANLEAGEAAGLYPVDRSLERIQGRARLTLERHRNAARLAAVQQLGSERIDRGLRIQAAKPEVVVPPRAPQPGDPQGEQANPPPPKPAADDPFGTPSADPAATPAPAEAAPPAAADPNAAPPARPAAPPKPKGPDPFAEQDPFGEKAAATVPAGNNPPVTPPPAAPAKKPEPAPANDPFAPPAVDQAQSPPSTGKALGNALKNFLGGLLPEMPADLPIANPFNPVKAAPDDPFGNPPPATNAPPASAPPANKPAAKDDDPFATPPAAKPAEKPAEKDPFGNN